MCIDFCFFSFFPFSRCKCNLNHGNKNWIDGHVHGTNNNYVATDTIFMIDEWTLHFRFLLLLLVHRNSHSVIITTTTKRWPSFYVPFVVTFVQNAIGSFICTARPKIINDRFVYMSNTHFMALIEIIINVTSFQVLKTLISVIIIEFMSLEF